MGKFLHSLPWTLALALAQAGEATSLPLPGVAAPTAAEEGVIPGDSAPSPLFTSRRAPGETDLSLDD